MEHLKSYREVSRELRDFPYQSIIGYYNVAERRGDPSDQRVSWIQAELSCDADFIILTAYVSKKLIMKLKIKDNEDEYDRYCCIIEQVMNFYIALINMQLAEDRTLSNIIE